MDLAEILSAYGFRAPKEVCMSLLKNVKGQGQGHGKHENQIFGHNF